MRNVRVPTSDSYHNYLVSSLREPEEAAAYLTAILEEQNPEPELLHKALNNVAAALGEQSMTTDQAHDHLKDLDDLRLRQGSAAIDGLASWLNALGLQLIVTPHEAIAVEE